MARDRAETGTEEAGAEADRRRIAASPSGVRLPSTAAGIRPGAARSADPRSAPGGPAPDDQPDAPCDVLLEQRAEHWVEHQTVIVFPSNVVSV